MNDILEHRLSNGLTVLTRESHAAPLVSFFTWYRVGARNEPLGLSGASHWVEHMLFKRTKTLNPGDIGRLVNGVGGTWNGFTSEDATAYYETVPKDHVGVALQIESDRMVNAVFDPDDVASERTVIISEREGNESSPMFLLGEAIEQAAFTVHPYGHGVIGSKADLNTMTREDLYGYYRRHYGPDTAVVVAVGDFETSKLLTQVEGAFGAYTPVQRPAGEIPVEPEQTDGRRVEVHHPGPYPILVVSHHVPPMAHKDFFALMALDALLSGPKAGAFGGGGTLRTSRLYQRFVASGLAAGAGSDLGINIDPTLMRIVVVLKPGSERSPVEAAVMEEIKRLVDAPPSDDELARAVRQARAKQAIALESVTSQAIWAGFLATTYTHAIAPAYTDRLAAVTPADVHRAAQVYLRPQNRITGWFIPSASNGAA